MTSPTPADAVDSSHLPPTASQSEEPSRSPQGRIRAPHIWLFAGLLAIGVVLTATVVPGVFTVDEDNYLATVIGLKRGDLSLPGTERLPPSFDLYWFDPWPQSRGAPSTPVVSVAPPLYAFLALPFSYLGWRGLIALNTLSFLIAAWLVFRLTERYATNRAAPWIATSAFVFGSFNIEYAQGMWPHMLSVALCLGAFALASDVRAGRPELRAVGAGLLAGMATGVRYQNVVFAAFVGLGLLLWAKRRWLASVLYGVGIGLPLALSSVINELRFGSWNPVSKGGRYVSAYTLEGKGERWLDIPHALFAKLIDFRAHPPIGSGKPGTWGWGPDDSGAFVFMGTVKKAFLQSSPWLALAFGLLALAWWTRSMRPEERNEARAASLVIGGVLGLFALSGFRHDGLCFNQRYFLELVPLGAIALGWGFDRLQLSIRPFLCGALLAALLAGVMLWLEPGSWPRTVLLMNVPLVLAAALLVAWAFAIRGKIAARLPAALIGASLVWSMGAHSDDLRASRLLRGRNAERLEAYSSLIPENVAFFTFWGSKDALGPLLLERDFVIVDPNNSRGADTTMLVDALLDRGTPVLIDAATVPRWLMRPLLERYAYRVRAEGRWPILELGFVDSE